MKPDYLMTLSLPRSAWATVANVAELQMRVRWLVRYLQRHRLLRSYCWVREEGAPNPDCVCDRSLEGCVCGANGRQLHRHFLLTLGTAANRFGRRWLPYARLQAAAKRCGLGTLDFRPVTSRGGASRYVSKYLAKTVAAPVAQALGRARRYAFNVPDDTPHEEGWSWSPLRVALVAVEFLGARAVDWDATRWSPEAEPS